MITIVKKHFLEWISGGTHGRAGGYEILINMLVVPFIMVMIGPKAAGMTLPMAAAFMPLGIVIAAAADQFAGERERGTLDITYMLPISDRKLFLGKIAAAVAYGSATCASAWLFGGAVILARHYAFAPLWSVPVSIGAFAIVGTFIALLVAALGLRGVGAQQVTMYSMYIILGCFVLATFVMRMIGPSALEAVMHLGLAMQLSLAVSFAALLLSAVGAFAFRAFVQAREAST